MVGSPGGFDMNNPMIMGLMSLFASQNPQTAGPMLDRLGIPPPMGLGGPQQHPFEIQGSVPEAANPQSQYSSQVQKQPAAPPTMEQIAPEPPSMGDVNFGQTAGPPSPSSMSPSIAAMMQPTMQPQPAGGEMGGGMGEGVPDASFPQGGNPAAAGGGMDPAQLAKLAAFAGVKAPQPIQPIMNGGVTGGVKPPNVELGGGFGTGVPPGVAMLLQAMSGGQRQNPLITPDIGSLIRGRG